jgi:hypothetical protein
MQLPLQIFSQEFIYLFPGFILKYPGGDIHLSHKIIKL